MDNNITLSDIYNVVIKLDGKINKLEDNFKSLDKKVSDTKKELITHFDQKIKDTKEELIAYVNNTKEELIAYVDNTKEELIAYVDNTKEELIAYVDNTKEELIAYVDNTKEELIAYVDKKVDTAKNEVITYVNMKVNYAIHKINEETSDFIEKDVYNDYQKLEKRVSDLEEFSKKQGYVLKVCEDDAEYNAD